jgi:hypothetical protein
MNDKYEKFKEVYKKVWLRSRTEEDTVKDTMGYCHQAKEEKNEKKEANFCPLAKELQNSWNEYQKEIGGIEIKDKDFHYKKIVEKISFKTEESV